VAGRGNVNGVQQSPISSSAFKRKLLGLGLTDGDSEPVDLRPGRYGSGKGNSSPSTTRNAKGKGSPEIVSKRPSSKRTNQLELDGIDLIQGIRNKGKGKEDESKSSTSSSSLSRSNSNPNPISRTKRNSSPNKLGRRGIKRSRFSDVGFSSNLKDLANSSSGGRGSGKRKGKVEGEELVQRLLLDLNEQLLCFGGEEEKMVEVEEKESEKDKEMEREKLPLSQEISNNLKQDGEKENSQSKKTTSKKAPTSSTSNSSSTIKPSASRIMGRTTSLPSQHVKISSPSSSDQRILAPSSSQSQSLSKGASQILKTTVTVKEIGKVQMKTFRSEEDLEVKSKGKEKQKESIGKVEEKSEGDGNDSDDFELSLDLDDETEKQLEMWDQISTQGKSLKGKMNEEKGRSGEVKDERKEKKAEEEGRKEEDGMVVKESEQKVEEEPPIREEEEKEEIGTEAEVDVIEKRQKSQVKPQTEVEVQEQIQVEPSRRGSRISPLRKITASSSAFKVEEKSKFNANTKDDSDNSHPVQKATSKELPQKELSASPISRCKSNPTSIPATSNSSSKTKPSIRKSSSTPTSYPSQPRRIGLTKAGSNANASANGSFATSTSRSSKGPAFNAFKPPKRVGPRIPQPQNGIHQNSRPSNAGGGIGGGKDKKGYSAHQPIVLDDDEDETKGKRKGLEKSDDSFDFEEMDVDGEGDEFERVMKDAGY